MKKKIWLIIALVILMLFTALIWRLFCYTPAAIDVAKEVVLPYEDDYTFVAEWYLNDFQALDVKKDELRYDYYSTGKVTDQDGRIIELTEEETQRMQTVYSSYDNNSSLGYAPWDRVYVYDEFVAFCNEKGHDSIVYSQNDKKPYAINSPRADEVNDYSCVVSKISEHWYHVTLEWRLMPRRSH